MGTKSNVERLKQSAKRMDEKKASSSVLNSNANKIKRIRLNNEINFDTFESDLNSLGTTIQGIYDGWQTEETMKNTRSSIEAMQRRIGAYQEYQKMFGGADLTELADSYKSILEDWDDRTNLYGLYKDGKSYDAAKKNVELSDLFRVKTGTDAETGEDTYRGLTYDEVQAKLKEYKVGSDEHNFLSTYTGYTDLNDFDKAIFALENTTIEKQIADLKAERDSLTAEYKANNPNERTGSKEAAIKRQKSPQAQRINEINNQILELEKSKETDYYNELKTKKNQWKLDNAFDYYKHYMDDKDFEEAAQYVTTAKEATSWWGATADLESGKMIKYGDEEYEFINDVNGARNNINAKYEEGNGGASTYETKGYHLLTEDEKKVYNALYKKDKANGTNLADTFLSDMEITLSKRVYDKSTDRWNEWADSGILASAALTVATFPSKMAGNLGEIAANVSETISGKEYNPYNPLRTAGHFANDTRQYISENIAEKANWNFAGENIPAFLYNTATNIGDSALGAAIFGKGHSVIMGAGAFQQKAKEMVEAGEDESTVFSTAFASGLAEVVFEHIGLDNLFKIKSLDSGKAIFYSILKQLGIEGLEEMGTEVANIASDSIIRGKNSELYKKYKDLMTRGYSESEIITELAKQVGNQVGWAGVGGALSGAAMGTGASVRAYGKTKSVGSVVRGNNRIDDLLGMAQLSPRESESYNLYTDYAVRNNSENITDAQLGSLYSTLDAEARKTLESKKSSAEQKANAQKTLSDLKAYSQDTSVKGMGKKAIKTLYGDEGAESIISEGLESGKDTESYKLATEYKAKVESGKKLTTDEITNLVDANQKAYKDEVRADAEKRLADLGENTEGGKVAEIIAKKSVGERLTSTEVETLKNSEYGNLVYNEINNEEIVDYTKNMDEEDAKLFLSTYDGSADLEAFKTSFNLVTNYTENKFTQDYILEHRGVLTPKQVGKIYKQKITLRNAIQQKTIDDLKAKHKDKPFVYGKFDDSVIDYENKGTEGKVNWNSVGRDQKNAIVLIGSLAVEKGMDVELISDGLERGINGAYEIRGNKILIDIYAGMEIKSALFENLILPTFSHELTHWMKEKAPELYRKYDEYVFETLMASGKSEREILDERRLKMQKAHPNETFTDEEVRDEVIARASEDMFGKSEVIREFLDTLSNSEKKTFVEKVKEIFQKLKKWFETYVTNNLSGADEARAIRENIDRLDGQIKLWDEMLLASIEANQALKNEGVTGEELAQKVSKAEKNTTKGDVQNADRITENMTESERYEILKNREITLAQGKTTEYKKILNENPEILNKRLKKADAKKLIKKIATEFGVFHQYENSDFDIEFEFSRNNLDESMNKQKGNYDMYAQMLSCFPDVISNAVGIEAHNRNSEGYKVDLTLKQVYVLCSAFESDTDIVPVKLSIKEFTDKPNHLYIAVALESIKKDRVVSMGVPNNRSHVRTSPVTISIHELFSKINPKDIDFLKYIPNAFLNNEQIDAKQKAIGNVKNSDRDTDTFSRIQTLQIEVNDLRKTLTEMQNSEDFKAAHDKLSEAVSNGNVENGIKAYKEWQEKSGYAELSQKRDTLQVELENLRKSFDDEITDKALKEEKEAIAKSGLSEADYFRKQAVKEFGYTPYFYDAGYITPNGKMLNFSGEKGNHYGTRGQDHRAIGIVYANVEGSKAMVRFMNDGNVRIMAESPGIDLSNLVEPTTEQYSTIRKFIYEYAKEEFFNVDLSNENGSVVGSLQYENKINPTRIINDIKHYYATGEIRGQSEIDKFRYSDRDNLGNALSEEQKTYFADSKMRDDNGKLMVMYQGSKEEFFEFDRKKSSPFNLYGRGFYFTNSKSRADQYGDVTRAYYLNIKNPIATYEGDSIITKEQLRKYLKVVAENEDYSIENYGTYNIDEILNSVYGKSDYAMIQDISATAIGDLVEAIELFNKVNGTQFDGLILNSETIIFNSEQAKLTSNKKPTKNKDMRYCDRDNSPNEFNPDGKTLKEQLEEALDTSKSFERRYVYIGEFTQEFVEKLKKHIEIKKLPIVMNYRDAYLSMETKEKGKYQGQGINYHNLGVEGLESALLSFESPEYVILSKTKGKIELVLEGRDYKNRQLFSIVEVNTSAQSNRKNLPAHVVTSVYGKSNLKNLLANAETEQRIIFKKNEEQPQVMPQVQYERDINDYSSKDSLLQDKGKSQEKLSDRDNVSVYDTLGQTEKLLKENENLKEDVERLKERLKLERQVTHGNYFNENQLDAVAGHLRNKVGSTIDKKELISLLKDVYSYIAHSPDLNWYDMFAQCYDIAKAMINESKPITETNDYAKMILRDINKSRISLNDSQKQEAKHRFGDKYRNAFMGKVIIANDGLPLDTKWKSWASEYPDFFDATITDADQITALYDVYGALKSASEMVVEYDVEEQTRYLAREIYNQYWNISPIRTTADKYDKQIKSLNFKHREVMKEFRDNYEEKLKTQHKADKEKYSDLVKKIRERKDKEIAEVKKLGKERLDAYKENAERKALIQGITGNALTFNKWLTTNSKDYHIHEAMKGPVIKLLQAIDFSSKKMLKTNIPTQRDVTFVEAFADVKAMLLQADNMEVGLEELYGHDLAESIEMLVQASYNLVGDNNYVINQMSLQELQSLDNLVKSIKKVVAQLNKFHTVQYNKGAVNLANTFMEYGDKLGKLKKQDGKIAKFLKFRNATPYYFFKRLGEAGAKIFEAFQDGWDKLAFNTKTVIDYANATYTNKEVREWGKETKSFTLLQPNGSKRTFEMTTAQIMALHCVSKQEDALRHLLSSGMTLSRVDKKGNVVADYENISLTMNDLAEIVGTLTNRQKEVANKLQEFMNTVCAEWGNEISMARFAVKMFTTPNYFPIKVSPTTIPTDNTKEFDNASLFRLLNMSFTKARNKFAEQSIEIGDIFDIFAQHSSDMAKYNALALPVLDFNKFYQQKGKTEENKEYGVDNTLRTVFGEDAVGYLKRFVRDINGSQNVSRDIIGKTFFKNAKVAAVANNLRVVLLQPTAYFKASAVMDNKYLVSAPLFSIAKLKRSITKAEKYCGIIQWKSLGYYDTDISRGIKEKIKHSDTFKDKAVEFSLKGAEIADKVTFGVLWNACELEIRNTRKDLKVGSEEFYQAVGKRLREIVYATQVVDSTMTRSDMMRSADSLDKMLTTFGSEPIIAYNMLMDMAMQYSLDKKAYGKEEARKRNGKKIRKVITAYIVTNAVAALVESGFDAFRDDDEEEMNIEEFMKIYLKNFAMDLSIGNKLPVVKEAYSLIQGYSSSRMDTQWMEYLISAVTTWGKILSGNGEGKGDKAIKDALKLASNISGYAFYNIYRDLMATLYKLEILEPEEIEDLFG